MALNNIDQLFNNIPDEYKFDMIGPYKEYKETGSLTAYNNFMDKYNFYVNNMPSKSEVIYSDDEDNEKLEFYEEKIKPKNLFNNRRTKNKILHELYNKIPDNKIPNPEIRNKMLIIYLQIKNTLKNAKRRNMIKNDFIINRIFKFFGKNELMEYVSAKLSQVTFNKYLKQWKNITENTNLPFDMDNIEIRKYKPKIIKTVVRRNNKNDNNEIKKLYKIDINNYKPKQRIEKQKSNILVKLFNGDIVNKKLSINLIFNFLISIYFILVPSIITFGN